MFAAPDKGEGKSLFTVTARRLRAYRGKVVLREKGRVRDRRVTAEP